MVKNIHFGLSSNHDFLKETGHVTLTSRWAKKVFLLDVNWRCSGNAACSNLGQTQRCGSFPQRQFVPEDCNQHGRLPFALNRLSSLLQLLIHCAAQLLKRKRRLDIVKWHFLNSTCELCVSTGSFPFATQRIQALRRTGGCWMELIGPNLNVYSKTPNAFHLFSTL